MHHILILIKGSLVGDPRYLACLGYMGWGALLEGLPVAPFNVYVVNDCRKGKSRALVPFREYLHIKLAEKVDDKDKLVKNIDD